LLFAKQNAVGKKRNDENCTIQHVKIKLAKKLSVLTFTLIAILQCGTYIFYEAMLAQNWTYSTDYAQYGCQYAGVYDYYLAEFVFRIDNRQINNKIDSKETYKEISAYNKNTDSYKNILDLNTYSNKDNQSGILKDSNIFVIQMESTMTFCLESEFNGIEITPNFNELFKNENCFYFNNVSTTIGMGNTSDAEFAFMTGYYPTGDMTIAWEYYDYDFKMPALGNILSDYESYGYNGTNETFYNHKNLHEGLYGITNFRGLETYEALYPKPSYPEKYLNYWISDPSILAWARDTQQDANKRNKKCFSFVETITPHNPFYDLSAEESNLYCDFLEGNSTNGYYNIYDYEISMPYFQLTNYLNQVKFNDILLTSFLKDVTNPNSSHYLPNTVFILYGDHGNAIPKEFYESLYKKTLTEYEYRKLQLNIPVIFYDPSGRIKKSLGSDYSSILSQNKSNTDMFRTVLNLLGVTTDANYYGVNMFSGEPSYSYDPKNSDIITDGFIYNEKRESYYEYIPSSYNPQTINYVLNHRVKNDNYLNSLVYTSKKKTY